MLISCCSEKKLPFFKKPGLHPFYSHQNYFIIRYMANKTSILSVQTIVHWCSSREICGWLAGTHSRPCTRRHGVPLQCVFSRPGTSGLLGGACWGGHGTPQAHWCHAMILSACSLSGRFERERKLHLFCDQRLAIPFKLVDECSPFFAVSDFQQRRMNLDRQSFLLWYIAKWALP